MRSLLAFIPQTFAALLSLTHTASESSPRRAQPLRGLAILQQFNDSLPRNAGNGLRCISCHLDDGRRGNAMSWIGVTSRYPKYRSRRGASETLEQRINECIARSLAGRMLAEDDPAMSDMIAYLETLRLLPVPVRPDTVRLPGDTLRGADAYAPRCARCHGARAEGALSPAIAGARSYSIGAGLARQTVLATFVRWNMPHDAPESVGDQEAADIAAWLLRQPRPDHPGKELDWPNGDAPRDVAYATRAGIERGQPAPASRPLLRRRVTPLPASK